MGLKAHGLRLCRAFGAFPGIRLENSEAVKPCLGKGRKARMEREKCGIRAFTLVEVLVVLLIVGILTGALLVVSSAGAAKAKAVRVVEDMRSLKSAATLYFCDTGKWPIWMTRPDATYFEVTGGPLPSRYLDQLPKAADYWIGVASSADSVAVMLDASSLDLAVRKSLANLSPGVDLFGTDSRHDFASTPYRSRNRYALWYLSRP